MEEIVWTDELNTGVLEIDNQHRQIIDMLNRLLREPDTITGSETVADILHDMTRYAQEHFTTEEKILAESGYPDLIGHKEQHFSYRKKTVDLCKDTMLGFHAVPKELLQYLRNWWFNHIMIEDMKYRDFLAQQ